MPDILTDGNYLRPVPVGPPRYEYPFRKNGDRVTALFEQDYWLLISEDQSGQPDSFQVLTKYTPQELGIPHEVLGDFYLIVETKPVRVSANVGQFTRTWSRIPVTQTVYSALSFNKPEIAGFGTAYSILNVTGSGTSSSLGINYTYNNYAWDIVNNRVYGPFAATTSADSGGDTTLTWTAHGITTQRFLVQTNSGNYIFNSGQYTVVNANTITLTGFNFGTSATLSAKYLRDYTGGIDRIGTKIVSTFYLPGVTTGITTGGDITIPTPLLNDAAFLAAVVANLSGYLNYDTESLAQWLESPIYRMDCIQLNMADL